jgi:polyferredoxin
MGKMGYAKGLVRYDTENGLANRWSRRQLLRRVLRPRVLIYSAILSAVAISVVGHLVLRTPFKVDVIRDRGVLGREVEDGAIENVYRLQLINSAEAPRRFIISITGIDTIRTASDSEVMVGAAATRMFPLRIRIDAGKAAPGSHKVEFHIQATDDAKVSVRESSTFYVPR